MSKKLHILIATPLYPPSIGGPATYTALLEKELPKRGIRVSVATFDDVRHLPKIIRHLVFFWKIFKMAGKVDIVYAQDPVSVGLPALIATCLRGKKFFIKIVGHYGWEQGVHRFGLKSSLDDFELNSSTPFYVRFLTKVSVFTANKSNLVITPSNYLFKILVKAGVLEGKIKVIYNSFKLEDFSDSQIEMKGSPVLFTAGRFVPWKGFDFLIDIFPKILEKYPEANLFIAGSGSLEKDLKEKVRFKKLSDRIIFLGDLSHKDLLQALHKSDLFLLNTSYEGLSHILLEAMAVGGASIITTPVGGNPELIENGKNGILVPVSDEKSWLKSIDLALQGDSGHKMAELSKNKSHFFSEDRMISSLIEEFKEISK